jgi:hypothetical protein
VIIFIEFSNNSKWQFKNIYLKWNLHVTSELLKQVLKIAFITTLHHVKWWFVSVVAWQVTAYCTNRSNNNFLNKCVITVVHNSKTFPPLKFWNKQVLYMDRNYKCSSRLFLSSVLIFPLCLFVKSNFTVLFIMYSQDQRSILINTNFHLVLALY